MSILVLAPCLGVMYLITEHSRQVILQFFSPKTLLEQVFYIINIQVLFSIFSNNVYDPKLNRLTMFKDLHSSSRYLKYYTDT